MRILIVVFVLFALLAACSAPAEPVEVTREVTRVVEVAGPTAVPVEVTRLVEVTREVPVTVEVTRVVKERFEVTVVATPTMPPMPQTFLEISGEGDAITDNLEWGACEKAVFTWDAPGSRNIIIHLWKPHADRSVLMANDIAPANGKVLQPLAGGVYYFEITARGSSWTITGECLD